jgi:hypothetical protein
MPSTVNYPHYDLTVGVYDLSTALMPVSLNFTGWSTEIIWIERDNISLTEPFFGQTVARLRTRSPPARLWKSDLRWLIDTGYKSMLIRPDGFIFHISRCGSTLISNVLRDHENSIVISEAPPVVQLAGFYPPPLLPYHEERWNDVREHALATIFTIFGLPSTGQNTRIIIKLASWNIFALSLFRSIWPDVPCLIVVREPLEVVVSNLSAHSGWVNFRNDPSKLRRCLGWGDSGIAKMPVDEYCARVVGSMCATAAQSAASNCKVIDYDHINAKVLLQIRRFFKIATNEADVETINLALKTYSKDPARLMPYKDDRRAKRGAASPALRYLVNKFAREAYLQAKALSGLT